MVPPSVVLAFGTPSARVSPSLAPVRPRFAGRQVDGFNAGKLGLKVAERCSTIGVPPPIVVEPPLLKLPEALTLPVTLWLPLRLLPMSRRASLDAATPPGDRK